jgi:hypothetical protein
MMIVTIKQLAPTPLTRLRGEEAFWALEPRLRTGSHVDIDLSGTPVLSMSFLDGLIDKLAASNLVSKVTFVSERPGHAAEAWRYLLRAQADALL